MPALKECAAAPSSDLQFAASIALLRIEGAQNCSFPTSSALSGTWIPSALAGMRGLLAFIGNQAHWNGNGSEALLALGLLGDLEAVPVCLTCLGDPQLAPSAALALELLLGGGDAEDYVTPEKVDLDEYSEAERAKLARGERVGHNAQEPRSRRQSRLCQDVGFWKQRWGKLWPNLSLDVRYRHGQPHSPCVLVSALEAPSTPRRIRDLINDELVGCYGVDFVFETDLLVRSSASFSPSTGIGAKPRACAFRQASGSVEDRAAQQFPHRYASQILKPMQSLGTHSSVARDYRTIWSRLLLVRPLHFVLWTLAA